MHGHHRCMATTFKEARGAPQNPPAGLSLGKGIRGQLLTAWCSAQGWPQLILQPVASLVCSWVQE